MQDSQPPVSGRRFIGTPPVAVVRSQAALVRTMLDEVERATALDADGSVSVQLVGELARLGCRCVELAATLSAIHSPTASE